MKKDVKEIRQQIQKLKKKLKRVKKEFYAEFGEAVEREIIEKENYTIEKLQEIYNRLKEKYKL